MDPKLWGNGSWFLIFHTIFFYSSDIEKMKRILWCLCNSLPCLTCKTEVLKKIEENNIMSSTKQLDILCFFAKVRNSFQKIKNNYQMIIPLNKLEFIDEKFTLSTKANVFSRFCYELEIDEKEKNLIHSRFMELL